MRRFLLLALLVAFGCVTSVAAGGITLSTGQSDYTVLVGEEATIPIAVENTIGADTTGVLTQGLRFVPESGGPATRTQSRPITLFLDTREIAVSAGTATEPGTFFFDVAFEYGDWPRTHVALPEIRVHVVQSATEQTEQTEQQVSSVSSVSTSSGTGELQGGTSSSSGKQPGQMPQDMSLLQDQAAREHDRMQALRSALLTGLEEDPLVREIHAILTSHGYVRATTTIDPTGEDTGTFVFGYRGGSGEAIRASGLIANGTAAYAAYATDRSLVVPVAVPANETYRRFASDLADAGFFPVSAAVNATPGATFVSVGFADDRNRPAAITATLVGGEVRAVDLKDPPDLLPLAAAGALCIVLLIAYLVRRGAPKAPEPPVSPVPGDPRAEALRLLDEARGEFDRGDRKEAYGTAGRALRSYVSSVYGTGAELADGDVLRLIEESGRETVVATSILEQCAAVSYAGFPPGDGEFWTVIRAIEALIGQC
ncbi:MAG: hypothetical protein LLF90_02595 [Methanomicrobiaceae archaeon]|nr:hypothetical protein [Methanomicrobiaceae archaeon]